MRFTLFTLLACALNTVNAQLADNWCGTTVPDEYRQYYVQRNRTSDDYDFQKRSSIRWVPVVYHVVAKNDGTGASSLKKIFETHCEMNEDFHPFNIGFFIHTIDTIYNTALWNYQNQFLGYQAFAQYNISNTCNIYVNGNLPGLCGFATFPSGNGNNGGIFMNTSCVGEGTATLQHEMGHYLGLLHTFDNGNGVEFVNGSNCATAGDLFCDTPADFLDNRTPCPYTGAQTDQNGDLYRNVIDETLFMSYFNDNCVNRFSVEQQAEMNSVLTNRRPGLLNQPVPNLNALDTTTFVSPLNGDTSILSSSVEFKWNAVPGARFYIFRLQSTTSNIAFADTLIRDTFFVANNLIPNRNYRYRVKAISYGNTCGIYTTYNVVKTSTIRATTTITRPGCAGNADGAINLVATNGVAPYTYLWSNGETTALIENLMAGTYTVTITDGAGEIVTASYTVNEPDALLVNVQRVGNNINAYASGGKEPYTYEWSNGVTGQFNNNVEFGEYTLSVTDANGCVTVQQFLYSSSGVLNNPTLKVDMFPNPVTGNTLKVMVSINENTNAEINILSLTGQVLQAQQTTFNLGQNLETIQLNGLSNGVYIVQIKAGSSTLSKRVSVVR